MSENTHVKELQSKVDTLYTMMDQNEQRFKTIEQHVASLPLI